MTNILDNLNPAQREAVSAPDGPLLILAGAGSGKTRVLTHRIAWLKTDRQLPAGAIAGLTFTNKAAEEMRTRLNSLAGPDAQSLVLHTFHALGVRLLREFGEKLKLPASFAILDSDDSLALIRRELKILGRPGEIPGGPAAIQKAIGRAKGNEESPDHLREAASNDIEETIALCYARYESAKARLGAADFDDLILLPTRLLTEFPDIAENIHDRIRHVLVDEYQDTSPAQYRFLRALVGKARNLTCVGDPDQSIYRWRGADIRNILEFEQDFPDARIITMEQNYRSTGRILKAASLLISHNVKRRQKGLWTAAGAGCPLATFQAVDETDEAAFIASGISRIISAGAKPGDFAILYRTHAQSRALEEAVSQQRLPYGVFGGVKFYARREVKDMLAYLRVLANPADSLSLARALASPPRGAGATSLAKLISAAESSGRPVLEILASAEFMNVIPARSRPSVADFLNLINRMAQAMAEKGYTAALTIALEESGYMTWLERKESASADSGNAADRRDNLRELASAVRTAEESGSGLHDFLERAALLSDTDRTLARDEIVTLMTLHNAKGLEFKHVFICGLEEGLLPHASSFHDDDELEEERRLLYVGITRARESAILTSARSRRQYDRFQWNSESRFLSELATADTIEIESSDALPLPEITASPAIVKKNLPEKDGTREITRVRVDEELPEDDDALAIGEEVYHHQYGVGRVETVTGRGKEMRVVVNFRRAGRKTMMAGVAKLTRTRGYQG